VNRYQNFHVFSGFHKGILSAIFLLDFFFLHGFHTVRYAALSQQKISRSRKVKELKSNLIKIVVILFYLMQPLLSNA
jgi:hypothetical protein